MKYLHRRSQCTSLGSNASRRQPEILQLLFAALASRSDQKDSIQKSQVQKHVFLLQYNQQRLNETWISSANDPISQIIMLTTSNCCFGRLMPGSFSCCTPRLDSVTATTTCRACYCYFAQSSGMSYSAPHSPQDCSLFNPPKQNIKDMNIKFISNLMSFQETSRNKDHTNTLFADVQDCGTACDTQAHTNVCTQQPSEYRCCVLDLSSI